MTVINDYTKAGHTDFADRTVTTYATPTIVPVRTTGSRPPVFCIHPIDGLTSCYAQLAMHFVDRPVYGVQASASGVPPTSLSALAAHYADEILAVRGSESIHLLGSSFGGLLAHAVAVELQRRGVDVDGVTLLGSDPLRHENETSHERLTRMGDDIDRSRAEELLALASHHDALAVRHFPGVFVGTAVVVSDISADNGPAWHPFVSGDVVKYTVPDMTDHDLVGELINRVV